MHLILRDISLVLTVPQAAIAVLCQSSLGRLIQAITSEWMVQNFIRGLRNKYLSVRLAMVTARVFMVRLEVLLKDPQANKRGMSRSRRFNWRLLLHKANTQLAFCCSREMSFLKIWMLQRKVGNLKRKDALERICDKLGHI